MTAKNTKETLIRPPSAMLVAPNAGLWSDIILGRQTGSIRTGHRDYPLGTVMLCCPIASACVKAEIVEVRHCRFRELALQERKAAGFNGSSAMALAGMRRHYPDLTADSAVTFVRWKDVGGTLVERRQIMMAKSDVADDPILDGIS